MGKQIRKGRTISTRNGYPIRESMGTDSVMVLADLRDTLTDKQNRNAAAIRGMHK